MKSLFEQQAEFFVSMDSATVESHGLDHCCNLAEKLIEEEVINETLPALRKYQTNPSLENLTELADGIVDSVYVLLDAANRFGIPFDLVWDEIHRSNLAKVDEHGVVKRNKDGKVMKPPGWKPPDVFGILMEYQALRQYGQHYMNKGMVK